jgi:hypothetical protein
MPSQGSARDSWNYVLHKGEAADVSSSSAQVAPPLRSHADDAVSLMSLGQESEVPSLAASVAASARAAVVVVPQAPGKRQSVLHRSQS